MILVIGGTGKVGLEAVKQLAQKRALARVLVRSAQKAQEIEDLGLETIRGDLTNIAGIKAALKGVEKVFLLTPPSPNEAELKSTLVDAAIKAGVTHLVLLSGAGAAHDSAISQAQQHAKADDHLKASGLAFTILQPYFFMQNFLNQTAAIKSQGAIYGNYKNRKLAMVDTRDIAAVASACLTESGHDGRTYVISGGEAIAHAEIAEKLSAIRGKKINYVDLSSEQLMKGLTGLGYPEWLASDLTMLGEDIAEGHFAHITDVVAKVAKKKPITFEQFARDNAQAFS